MQKLPKYPILFLRNCDPKDETVYWLELNGVNLNEVHEQVGKFVMGSLSKWQEYKVTTGQEPHVHIEPRALSRKTIDQLEVIELLDDDRTKRETG